MQEISTRGFLANLALFRDMAPADLDRIGGQLYVLSGRALGAVFLSIVARPVGGR